MATSTDMSHSSTGGRGSCRTLTEQDREEFRRELGRVLESEVFSSSRRLVEFLLYVGEMALEGRNHVDQYEIAERVLHRDEHFNPLDDASVRKLASQVRHKLEEYYAGEGQSNPVVISLPRRSYVPHFRYRRGEFAPSTPDEPTPEQATFSRAPTGALQAILRAGAQGIQAPIRAVGPGWIAAFLMAVVVAALGFRLWRLSDSPPRTSSKPDRESSGAIVIATQRGDLRGPEMDVAAGAVLLGLPVGTGEEVTVKMTSLPSHATHQVGVMVFDTPDRYVRLGRHFKTRVMREFAQEAGGLYHGPEGTYEYDPKGQTGDAVWLSIRRDQMVFRAYTSPDGLEWKEFGHPIIAAEPMTNPRAAIYGFNGRTDIPSSEARFENFSVGVSFHNRPAGPWDGKQLNGWTVEAACPGEPTSWISDGALTVSFSDSALGCSWRLLQRVPEGDWTLNLLMDFHPVTGNSAGLAVRGTDGELRLVRRDLNGGSIMMELDDDSDVSVPDFPGYPLLWLRLQARRGLLTGQFSRDGIHFDQVPRSVPISQLGADLQFGLAAEIAHWSSSGHRPPVRFYRIERSVETVEPLKASEPKATTEKAP